MRPSKPAALDEREPTRSRRPARGRSAAAASVPYRFGWWTWSDPPTFDEVCEALAFQYALLDELLHPVRRADWHAPTRLAGWRVADLLGHLIVNAEHVVGMTQAPPASTAGQNALDWYQGSGLFASMIEGEARAVAARARRADLAGLAVRHRSASATAAAILRSGEPGRILGGAASGITLAEYSVTRLVEAVVHGLDLADALGSPEWAWPGATRLVSGYFAALGDRAAPTPSSARIAVDTAGTLITLGRERGGARIPAVTWIETAAGRRPSGDLLPASHAWLAGALPLLA